MMLLGVARVSTEDQAGDNGEGLARQRREIELIAKRHNLTLIRIIDIIDVTGSSVADSTEWQRQVLPAIKDPQTHIAVDAVDRLCRASKFASFQALEDCERTNTKVYLPKNVKDMADPEDFEWMVNKAVSGGREKAEIKRRTFNEKEILRRQGRWVSSPTRVPLGFSYAKKAGTWTVTPDMERVQAAYRQIADGVPIARVAALLGYADGNCRKILQNPIYRGILIWDKKVGPEVKSRKPLKDGKQQPKKMIDRDPDQIISVRIIPEDRQPVSDALWQEVQNRMKSIRGRRLSRKSEAQAVCWATGHLQDAELFNDNIGVRLIDEDNQPKARRLFGHLHDKNHWRYHVVDKDWSLAADRLNFALDRYMDELTAGGEFVRLAQAAQEPRSREEDDDLDLAAIERQLVNLAKQQKKANYRHEIEAIGDAELKAITATIKKEVAALEAKRDAPKPVRPSLDAVVNAVKALAWPKDGSPEMKRAWLAVHTVDVYLTPDAIMGCRVRLNTGEVGMTTMGAGYFRKLDDLLVGFRPARMAGYMTTTEVAGLLGLKPSTLRKRLRAGTCPGPKSVIGGDGRQWTEADVTAARLTMEG
jgi:DNA invertase Pin-like site-specific DNA recombinase